MRQYGGGGIAGNDSHGCVDSWWDNPGQPTPYVLWGLVWCGCGTPMVPLDRRRGSATTQRFYRCDAGCGREPVPAVGLETTVFRAVTTAALAHVPRYSLRGVRTWRVARLWAHSDLRRRLIRGWIARVVAPGGGQPAQLHWQGANPPL